MKGKSVLVTGGAGFIGSHLVDELITEEPKNIIVVDNMSLGKDKNLTAARDFPGLEIYKKSATDYQFMKFLIKSRNIDVVFNLAVVPLPASLVVPRESTNDNIEIVTALCELQRLGCFETLVHFSSSEVYGTAQYVPMDELHPLGAHTPYAASKAAGDLIVLSYNKTFGSDCVIVRPFNNYGPRQNEGVYAGVIPQTIERIMKGGVPFVTGDGKQTRDYIYVTDTVKTCIEIYKNEDTRGKIINLGSGVEISILDLMDKIIKLTGCDKKIEFKEPRIGDVEKLVADVSLAKNLLDFEQQVDFEEGIKTTIDWYKNSLDRRILNGKPVYR